MKVPKVNLHVIDELVDRNRLRARAASKKTAPPPKGKSRKKRQGASPKAASGPVVHDEIVTDDQLRRDLAQATMGCVSFYSLDRAADLIEPSAVFLEALIRLWAMRDVDAAAVWREMDHRLQLGNLLNRINHDMPIDAETTRKYWRPSSTKLP